MMSVVAMITRPCSRTASRNLYSSQLLPYSCFSMSNLKNVNLQARYGLFRLMSNNVKSIHKHANFFRYTSGRWLWDEEKQLLDRFTPFNVLELQRVAARSIGANKCITMTKLAEGSFNKTFRLIMDDGSVVIARVPHPIAGPKHHTTASEVATMDFARTVLQIPIPKVHAWSSGVDNSVGAEYIIMEEAPGTKLADVWDELSLEDRISVMKDLVMIENKLLSVSFNSFGNLYYSSYAINGAVTAEVIDDSLPLGVRNDIRKRFSIGPVVERDFWNKERSEMKIDRGPWKLPQEYAIALAHREQAWIKQYAKSKPLDNLLVTSTAQSSTDAHLSLLQKYLKVAPYLLPTDPDIISSTLWHTDLHSGNLFVDKGRITSIIDWQETWAGPLVLQARHPRLVDYQGDIILKPPANFKDLESNEKAQLKKQIASSIIIYLYEKQTAKTNPRLYKLLHFKLGRIRCEPISFVGDTWDDDILPLRESLIRIERYWDELGFDFPCPIHFTEAELQNHAKDGIGWNDVQEFWNSVADIVARDGWTPEDMYDDAVTLFSELRESGLKTMVGKDREDFKGETQWVESLVSKIQKDNHKS